MQTPTAGQLLDAWDTASALRPASRCDALLELGGYGEEAFGADISLGERDRRLIELRERLFGRTMPAVAACPDCGLAHDLELSTSALLGAPAAREPDLVRVGDVTVVCRALCPEDLAAAAAAPTATRARSVLLSRAVVSAERDGRPLAVVELPEPALAAVADALAEADPLASVDVPLCCEDCGNAWTCVLDIAEYLWRELDGWATRALKEIDTLARAYGWTEPEVLALSARRRRRYLELVGDG